MAEKMKCLVIKHNDFDINSDWLTDEAAKTFIDGKFTHIICANEVVETEVIKFDNGGYGVMLGECISENYGKEEDTFIYAVQQVVDTWKSCDEGDGHRPDLLKALGKLIESLEEEVFV